MSKLKAILTTLFLVTFLSSSFSQVNYLTLPKDRQFDFWVGVWDVNLRIIQDDNTWENKIKSKAKIYSINGGRAILELWNDQRPTGIKGFSLRYYNFETERWDLWLNWPNKNSSQMGPLFGNFRHGRGEFVASSGENITRYSFSDISPYYLRWDDAYSKDGGKTWTNNWIMEFTRTQEAPDWPNDTKGHTHDQGGRCDLPAFDAFRALVGDWTGTIKELRDEEWVAGTIDLNGFEVLNGCAVINRTTVSLEGKISEEFSIKTFNTGPKKLEDARIGDQKEDNLRRFYGDFNSNKQEYTLEELAKKDILINKYEWNLSQSGRVTIQIHSGINSEKPVWKKTGEIVLNKK